jgi:hypothetical protein
VYGDFCQPLRGFDSTLSCNRFRPTAVGAGTHTRHPYDECGHHSADSRRRSGEQFSIFENPDLLCAVGEARVPGCWYRIFRKQYSARPAERFRSNTPATAGTHIADALRTRRDSQQHVAELRAQNDELRMQLRQVQMHHATQTLTPPPAPPQKEISSQPQQNAPTLLRLVLALLIGS